MPLVRPCLIVAPLVPALLGFAPLPGPIQSQPLAVRTGDKVKLKQCIALTRCRSVYTRCFNRIQKKFPANQWNAERDKCVVTYKICIKKTFSGTELFFTRWFVPDADCTQYR